MIAPSTVRKILCKYNLKAKVYNKNIIISHINWVKRVTFCRTKLYQNSTKNGLNWWNVVFSDETMIELQPTRRILVRRPPNLGFHPLFTPKFKKVPAKKLMIWGCVRSNGERLIFPIKNKVNADVYIDCLENKVLPFLNLHEVFQQDNAPAHTAEKTMVFFKRMPSRYWKTGPHNLRT